MTLADQVREEIAVGMTLGENAAEVAQRVIGRLNAVTAARESLVWEQWRRELFSPRPIVQSVAD